MKTHLAKGVREIFTFCPISPRTLGRTPINDTPLASSRRALQLFKRELSEPTPKISTYTPGSKVTHQPGRTLTIFQKNFAQRLPNFFALSDSQHIWAGSYRADFRSELSFPYLLSSTLKKFAKFGHNLAITFRAPPKSTKPIVFLDSSQKVALRAPKYLWAPPAR